MSRFNVNQTHPLIPRQQNYVLEKKLISFHSEDRDIKQWPKTNIFQIELPEPLSQVQSMRLVSVSLPSNQYVFSNEYQNTKFSFSIDLQGEIQEHIVEISEGSYTPDELATEIANTMNFKIVEKNESTYSQISTQEFFRCKYNKIKNTFWFGLLGHTNPPTPANFKTVIRKFSLNFQKKMSYMVDCNSTEVWENYAKWGLPFYLGYEKKKYISTPTPYNPFFSTIADTTNGRNIGGAFGFNYEIKDTDLSNQASGHWLNQPAISSSNNLIVDISKNPCTMNILGEDWIYMEVEKHNTIDEIRPYSTNTSGWFNNDYNGKVNSAFAKIPVENNAFSSGFVKNRNILSNVSFYTPPLARVKRFKFKFRYHDGRLVDFKCMPISFVIEFNVLRDEQAKTMNVIVPPSYMFS